MLWSVGREINNSIAKSLPVLSIWLKRLARIKFKDCGMEEWGMHEERKGGRGGRRGVPLMPSEKRSHFVKSEICPQFNNSLAIYLHSVTTVWCRGVTCCHLPQHFH
jgi:ribosomal protein S27E